MTILDQIVNTKKTKLPNSLGITHGIKPKPFLKKGKFQIIAEIKKGSPSLGLLKPDLDVASTAAYYEENGASAISVLTEEDYFYGSTEDLKRVKKTVALPVLRKDFIFTKEQIVESYNLGADAILLIVAVIKEADNLSILIKTAEELHLSVLVEIHDKSELETAVAAGAKIIGINNRNLKTFKTDINTSIELIRSIPSHIISVSESGIHTQDDLNSIISAGFDAALIGEAFIRNKEFLRDIKTP